MSNPARGEVEVTISGERLVIVSEMKRLASLSSRLGNPPLDALLGRLSGFELEAIQAACHTLVADGDGKGAFEKCSGLDEVMKLGAAFNEAMAQHLVILEDMPGKPETETGH